MTPNTSSSPGPGPWSDPAAGMPPPAEPAPGPWSAPRGVWNRPAGAEAWWRFGGFLLLATSLWLVAIIALFRALAGLFS